MPHGPGTRRRAERTALERAVDEGLLIVRAALVVAVTNQIIRRALQERLPFDEDVATRVTRDEIDRLTAEQTSAAVRVRRLRRMTGRSYGQSRHQFDYRPEDADALKLREAASKGVARALAARREDDDFVAEVVADARSRAWDDVGQTVVDRLGWAARPADDYDDGRHERLRDLVEGDLAALRESRSDGGAGSVSPS
ncbi:MULTISPECIES: hypothetical protein [unclassified Frigoribacterium]|uniref:hypothetical protein n=1 Tax=unclassified Frigoribacterium TaxID=2627005 RepID=UPI0012F18C62|nr:MULTISPECIES: hypothetical protein [unclassified Frigoribacterium]MBD8140660.1 hypothetical protein [Frigoribacterium sp. CFBP 13605]NQW86285.1 hypothetical protein [Frigoribacterium sp. VKM Ac-2860]NQX07617.1 hypothetical protein [Frigoribacterium sp. VKM Ac-2859]VXC17713.1 conserved hypothetical protein [Frigoribacterium sp. 9N]